MLLGAASAVVPDLDALWEMRSKLAAWRLHRVFLHGLPTLPIQAALLAAIAFAVLPPGIDPVWTCLVIAGGLVSHLLLDVATSFGTALGFPFHRKRYSTHSHFIVDPVILLLIAVSLVAQAAWIGLLASAAWLIVGVATRQRVMTALRHRLAKNGVAFESLHLEPGPLAPFVWLAVLRRGPDHYALARVTWQGHCIDDWSNLESTVPPPLRERLASHPLVQAFLATAHCPLWTLIDTPSGGTAVVLEDVKWRIWPPFRPLAFLIDLATDGSPARVTQMPLTWRGPAPRQAIAPQSPLNISPPHAVVVTTAVPPWYTGTAINPIQRAKALASKGWQVTLVFPWLEPKQQPLVFPSNQIFQHQAVLARWLQHEFEIGQVRVRFYPASWSRVWRSLFPSGRFARHIPSCDLLVLEEPEHLALWRPWLRLRQTSRFGRVVGILHTHYAFYLQARADRPGLRWMATHLTLYLNWVTARNCHQTIRLSAAVEGPANSCVANVHGVDARFFTQDPHPHPDGVYFIGKLIWEKGLREMVDLLSTHRPVQLHLFGTGPSEVLKELSEMAPRQGVDLILHGPTATPWEDLRPLKVFINCSRSEVLCTATAEALAMGKFVLVPRHPSNSPFERHPNCLVYETPQSFAQLLTFAMATQPQPVDSARIFSWDTATERLLHIIETERSGTPSGLNDPNGGATHPLMTP